ncbi:FecR domain-containing protein [Limibacter armeniacum]|uniref:FecR family protein n=1 Tax=Limibacter armeniacum TaxID=466084 RepID=UPI002FE5CE7B
MNDKINWTLISQYLGKDGSDEEIRLVEQMVKEDASFARLLKEITSIWEESAALGKKTRLTLSEAEIQERILQVKQKLSETEAEESKIARILGDASDESVSDGEFLQSSQQIWKAAGSIASKRAVKLSDNDLDSAMAKMKSRISQMETGATNTPLQTTVTKSEKPAAATSNVVQMKTSSTAWMKYVGAAAVVLLVLGAGFFILKNEVLKPEMSIAIAKEEAKRIQLADGSEVWLSEGSELSYPVAFQGNSRNVSLKGQAFFEVTKNPKKPFVIETENSHTRVLGTSFRLTDQAGQIEMEVVTGKVEFSSTKLHDEKVLLVGTEKASLIDGKMVKGATDMDHAASLMRSELEFKANTMTEVVNTLNKAYGKNITIESDELKERKFTGVLKNKSFDKAIEQVVTVIGAEANYMEDGSIVLK